MLGEVAFEPIDRRERRRSGVTKRAKTQRPRNYPLFSAKNTIGAQEGHIIIIRDHPATALASAARLGDPTAQIQ
jgi:hypothetical protein